MSDRVDIAVVGSGLGGLMAAALLARRGYSVAVFERSDQFGGAASIHHPAGLTIGDGPGGAADPVRKHLSELGLLDELPLIDVPDLYEVRGGPVGDPFRLPHDFDAARAAVTGRFPDAAKGASRILDDMAGLARALDTAAGSGGISRLPGMGRDLWPVVSGWNRTLGEAFARTLTGHEDAQFALAANLPCFDDNPADLWWPHFALAQARDIAQGGHFLRGGAPVLIERLVEVIRANGGTVTAGRPVSEIMLAPDGSARGIVHTDADGVDPERVQADVVLANAAPTVVTGMLPADARPGFVAAFRGRPLSISLFAAHFGLSRRPSELGLAAQSTILVPDWMGGLDDISQCGQLLGGAPRGMLPLLEVIDGSATAAASDGPPFVVTVVGVDRIANWEGLEPAAHDDRRDAWLGAIEAELERQFTGFEAAITSRLLATAVTHARALNAPGGALTGFAPMPPRTPIWKGYPRSSDTPVPGLLLASAYAGAGGINGALAAGGVAAERITRTKPRD